jgi:hypothetical protein
MAKAKKNSSEANQSSCQLNGSAIGNSKNVQWLRALARFCEAVIVESSERESGPISIVQLQLCGSLTVSGTFESRFAATGTTANHVINNLATVREKKGRMNCQCRRNGGLQIRS